MDEAMYFFSHHIIQISKCGPPTHVYVHHHQVESHAHYGHDEKHKKHKKHKEHKEHKHHKEHKVKNKFKLKKDKVCTVAKSHVYSLCLVMIMS